MLPPTSSLPERSPTMQQVRRHLISRKKDVFPISDYFETYLTRYGRLHTGLIHYEDLLRYNNSIPLYNEHGDDTLWSTVFYPSTEQRELYDLLVRAYLILKADADFTLADYLYIDRVDLCLYGNTLPFRIRVVNRINDNFDYFYVKRVDANRIYGLELEHILSPNRINYVVRGHTLIEEHVIGIPADAFMQDHLPGNRFDEVRLTKEFVKFNERCFVRLLGDMHAGNFVIDITSDFEKWHYRMRPIDFDQQSHHWRKQVYMPQFFPQNQPLIKIGLRSLAPENVIQYQKEERALIANRVRVSHERYGRLMEVMSEDIIAPQEHVNRLAKQLDNHYGVAHFAGSHTMGELVAKSIGFVLERNRPANPPFHERLVRADGRRAKAAR